MSNERAEEQNRHATVKAALYVEVPTRISYIHVYTCTKYKTSVFALGDCFSHLVYIYATSCNFLGILLAGTSRSLTYSTVH